MAVMVVVGDEAVVIVAVTGPLSWVQLPAPTLGVLAAMVALPGLAQMVCGGPALAVVGTPLTLAFISLVLAVHPPLLIVQRNTYVPTMVSPFTTDVGEEAVTIDAADGPLTWLHAPVPTPGVLAAMVMVPTDVQTI